MRLIANYIRKVNSEIELHDSVVAEISEQGGKVILLLSPAYLHKSEGRPRIDPGTGWVQEARLIFTNAIAGGVHPDLPCSVLSGDLVVCAKQYVNSVPVPLDSAEHVELRLSFGIRHTMFISGKGVTLDLIGKAEYVEEFRPKPPLA